FSVSLLGRLKDQVIETVDYYGAILENGLKMLEEFKILEKQMKKLNMKELDMEKYKSSWQDSIILSEKNVLSQINNFSKEITRYYWIYKMICALENIEESFEKIKENIFKINKCENDEETFKEHRIFKMWRKYNNIETNFTKNPIANAPGKLELIRVKEKENLSKRIQYKKGKTKDIKIISIDSSDEEIENNKEESTFLNSRLRKEMEKINEEEKENEKEKTNKKDLEKERLERKKIELEKIKKKKRKEKENSSDSRSRTRSRSKESSEYVPSQEITPKPSDLENDSENESNKDSETEKEEDEKEKERKEKEEKKENEMEIDEQDINEKINQIIQENEQKAEERNKKYIIKRMEGSIEKYYSRWFNDFIEEWGEEKSCMERIYIGEKFITTPVHHESNAVEEIAEDDGDREDIVYQSLMNTKNIEVEYSLMDKYTYILNEKVNMEKVIEREAIVAEKLFKKMDEDTEVQREKNILTITCDNIIDEIQEENKKIEQMTNWNFMQILWLTIITYFSTIWENEVLKNKIVEKNKKEDKIILNEILKNDIIFLPQLVFNTITNPKFICYRFWMSLERLGNSNRTIETKNNVRFVNKLNFEIIKKVKEKMENGCEMANNNENISKRNYIYMVAEKYAEKQYLLKKNIAERMNGIEKRWNINLLKVQCSFEDSNEYAQREISIATYEYKLNAFFVEINTILYDIIILAEKLLNSIGEEREIAKNIFNLINEKKYNELEELRIKIDAAKKEKQKKIEENIQNELNFKNKNNKCPRCENYGHILSECGEPWPKNIAKGFCSCCAEHHFIIDCPKVICDHCSGNHYKTRCPEKTIQLEPHIKIKESFGKIFFSGLPKKGKIRNQSCPFDAIICLTVEKKEQSKEIASKNGIAWFDFSISSWEKMSLNKIMEIAEKIKEYIENGKNILIHCISGIHRTGLVLTYMALEYEIPLQEFRNIIPERMMKELTIIRKDSRSVQRTIFKFATWLNEEKSKIINITSEEGGDEESIEIDSSEKDNQDEEKDEENKERENSNIDMSKRKKSIREKLGENRIKRRKRRKQEKKLEEERTEKEYQNIAKEIAEIHKKIGKYGEENIKRHSVAEENNKAIDKIIEEIRKIKEIINDNEEKKEIEKERSYSSPKKEEYSSYEENVTKSKKPRYSKWFTIPINQKKCRYGDACRNWDKYACVFSHPSITDETVEVDASYPHIWKYLNRDGLVSKKSFKEKSNLSEDSSTAGTSSESETSSGSYKRHAARNVKNLRKEKKSKKDVPSYGKFAKTLENSGKKVWRKKKNTEKPSDSSGKKKHTKSVKFSEEDDE
ncbi:Kid domain containing protein, partial [Reticulomyxa filosa]